MTRGSIRSLLVAVLFLGTLGVFGCGKDPVAVPPPERLPETELTYAPLEGDTSSFRVHFFWNGYDDDGEITRFRYAVDADTSLPFGQWTSTEAKDTTLLFLVDPVTEIRGHVFWIVAEDNEGKFDPTPAKRFFSAKTIPPFSRITRGPNGLGTIIGPSFTFEWEGTDPDGGETGGPAPVDSFEYILLQVNGQAEVGHPKLPRYTARLEYLKLITEATGPTLNPPYDDWKWVGIRGTRKRFRNVTPDFYFFAVRAVDIAGATEKWPNPVLADLRNIRDFNVTNRNPGPLLEVSSSVLVQPLSPTSGPEDIVRKEIQIFEGETISFAWTANADTYGGEIVGYTYALDDTSVAEWGSIDLTKRGVTFTSTQLPVGPHFLFVRAVDDGGLVTNMKVPLRIVHPEFKDPPVGKPKMLYVDDFAPPPGDWATALRGSPNFPKDDSNPDLSEEDLWWKQVVLNPISQEFGFDLTADPAHDTVFMGTQTIEGRAVFLPTELAKYRVIVWSTDFNNTISSPTALWRTLVGGSYSELAGYLRAGGTLIVTGFQLASQTSDLSVPYVNYSRGMCNSVDEGSREWRLSYFPRNFMGIDGALGNDTALRSLGARDFVEARVTAEGAQMGFVNGEVHVGAPSTGAKWDPNAFSGGTADARLAPGLPKIDGWRMASEYGCFPPNIAGLIRRENAGPIAVPIFTYHGVRTGVLENGGPSPREGLIVGIATQAHDLGNAGGGGFITGVGNSSGAIGRIVFLGFPMYYIKDAQAHSIMRAAFAYVNASPTLPSYTP